MSETPEHMSEPQEQANALIAALAEIERHVSRAGWDQPTRLFALVRTDVLISQEPSLAAHLRAGSPDSLSSVEQEDFVAGEDLGKTLAGLQWPATVGGCAIALERTFLPPEFEGEIPDDPAAAEEFVHSHPKRQDARVVVGALRDGTQHGLGRLLSHPDELLGGVDFVPGLAKALVRTLQ